MKKMRSLFCLLISLLFSFVPEANTQGMYGGTFPMLEDKKAFYDDPSPLFQELSYKEVLPPDVYDTMIYDQEEMKNIWAEAVGFKSPEIAGKIAPEILPGTYSYKEKNTWSGLKQLMYPNMYKRFNPGASPFAANFSEITVVPTRQYYWPLPLAKATKENAGRTKLDSQGYLIYDTYTSGFPFPQPEGKFQAQHICTIGKNATQAEKARLYLIVHLGTAELGRA